MSTDGKPTRSLTNAVIADVTNAISASIAYALIDQRHSAELLVRLVNIHGVLTSGAKAATIRCSGCGTGWPCITLLEIIACGLEHIDELPAPNPDGSWPVPRPSSG